METEIGAPSNNEKPRPRFDYVAVLGYVVALVLALYLAWWMPARVSAGYVMPTIEGSVATLPQDLPVIWVRTWPWQGTAPAVDVTFVLPNNIKVTVPASVSARPGFYVRAVPATLALTRIPVIAPTEIVAINLRWPGGSSSASESALWVTARPSDALASGARTIWSTRLPAGARPAVELSLATHPEVISISSPAPGTTPWIAARCLADTSRGSVAATLLRGRLPGKPTACSRVQGTKAAIVTPALPGGYSFFVWQPALQELVNSHLRTVIVGKPLLATGEALTSSNWWQFSAAALTPGF